MMQILINLVAFIVAIGVLVAFHEFGHYWTARRLGVRVLRFSIGFGKPLWTWRDKANTEFVIAAIPLGGYVKMLDEREGPVPVEDQAYAFNRQSLLKRFLIVLAGPLFNFIFAFVAYWCVLVSGIEGIIPIVGTVAPHSIAEQAGLRENEEIVSIQNKKVLSWQQIVKELMGLIGSKDTLEIKTKTQTEENSYILNLNNWQFDENNPDLLGSLGIEPYMGPIKPIVHQVMPNQSAYRAGFQENDVIVAVNDKKIHEWRDFSKIIVKSPNVALNVLIERQGALKTLVLTPESRPGKNGVDHGFVGIVVKTDKMPPDMMRTERYGPVAALLGAFKKTKEYTQLTLIMLGKLITGHVGMKSLSGPITIAKGAGASVKVGFQYFLSYLALISISLGVLNLLPIPILDGGHLFYYLIEGVSGKPVSERFQYIGYKIGLFILLFVMSIAFYNDIVRLF